MSTSAFREMYDPFVLTRGSKETVVRSSWTGMFMKRLKGEGVNCGGVMPVLVLSVMYSRASPCTNCRVEESGSTDGADGFDGR